MKICFAGRHHFQTQTGIQNTHTPLLPQSVNTCVTHFIQNIRQLVFFHAISRILHFYTKYSVLFVNADKDPARSGLAFNSMDTGILYKRHQCKFRYPYCRTIRRHTQLIRKSVPKTVFLKSQVGFNKFHLLPDLHIVNAPVYVLPLHDGKLFHHIRGLIFSFQNTVHTDTLQRVEKKMRINLTSQGKKFRTLPGYIHLLLLQLVLIHCLDQIIHPDRHAVVIQHQAPDLILAAHPGKLRHAILTQALKYMAELPYPDRYRSVDLPHQKPGQNDVDKQQGTDQYNILPQEWQYTAGCFQHINL